MADQINCPFCGEPGEYRNVQDWHGVGCQTSKCPGIRSALYHRSRDAAFAAWNRRAAVSSASADRAMEVLRELVCLKEEGKKPPNSKYSFRQWANDSEAAWSRARALLSQAKERNMDRG